MSQEIFSQVLREFVDQIDLSVRQIAERAGVPVGTLRSWLKGRADKQGPRGWQDIAKVAVALHLTLAEADRLLLSAHSDPLTTLIKATTIETDRELLAPWIEEISRQSEPPDALRRADYFFGREQEVNDLIDTLMNMKPGETISLCGPGGIGKTAIVAETLHRLHEDGRLTTLFPDGVIVHDFYQQSQVEQAMETIINWFGGDPRPSPDRAIRRVLAGKKVLLVLEGVENTDELSILLEVTALSRILITSRRYQGLPGNEYEDIRPLDKKDSTDLLQAWGKERARNRQIAEQICDLVGHLPLAVELAGKYLTQRKQEAAEYLLWLQQSPLVALDQGRRRLESVSVLMDKSVDQLPEGGRHILSLVGSLAIAPFDSELVAIALDYKSVEEAGRRLGELVNWGLLIRQRQKYQVTHTLIHTHSQQRLIPPEEAIDRLAAYFTALADVGSGQGTAGYRRLDRNKEHILAVLARVQRTGDRQNEVVLLTVLGDIPNPIVNMPLGYYEEALEIAREIGDRRNEASLLRKVGGILYQLGAMESAIECYEQALEISEEMCDWQSWGTLISYLGTAYNAIGDVRSAIKYYEQALEVAQKVGDRPSAGWYLSHLGDAYRTVKDLHRAMGYYEQALEIAREIGDQHNESSLLGNLGIVYRGLENIDQAISYYEQALEVAQHVGNRLIESLVLGDLGATYAILGDVLRAIDYSKQALKIANEIDDLAGKSRYLDNLGVIFHNMGDIQQARHFWEQTLSIHEATESSYADVVRRRLQNLKKDG